MLHALAPFENPAFLRARVGDEPFVVGVASGREPLAASHDGRFVAGAIGPLVWVARTHDGVIVRYLTTEEGQVDDLRFSGNDARLFAIGSEGVISWRLADGQREVDLFHASPPGRADLSPDHSQIVAGAHPMKVLIDVATGAVMAERTIPGLSRLGERPAPVFTANGRYVALADTVLVAWDLAANTVAPVAASGEFSHVCAVGDGSEVIAAGPDRQLVRYDLANGRWIASGRGPRFVHGLLVEGRSLWVCGASRTDSATWETTAYAADTLEPDEGVAVASVPSLASVARRGETLFVTHHGRLTLTTIAASPSWRFDAPVRAYARALRINSCGTQVIASFGTHAGVEVVCWAIATGECVGAISSSRRHPLWLSDDAEFSPGDGIAETLASAEVQDDVAHVVGPGGRALAVRANSLAVLPDGPVFSLPRTLSRERRYAWQRGDALVLGIDYDRVSAFDLRTSEWLPPRSFSGLRAVAPLGQTAWVVTANGAQCWDFRTRTKLRAIRLNIPSGPVDFAAASRDGRRLAVGMASGAVVLIELDGVGRTVTIQAARTGGATAGAFSDDGALLATAGNEPCVRVWDVDAVLASAPEPLVVAPRARTRR